MPDTVGVVLWLAGVHRDRLVGVRQVGGDQKVQSVHDDGTAEDAPLLF